MSRRPSSRSSLATTTRLRRLSRSYSPHVSNGLKSPPSTVEDVKSEQFAHMMDRFQLRRVVMPRTSSVHANTAAPTSRDPTCHADDAPPQEHSSVIRRSIPQPFAPTGLVTQLRLLSLTVALLAQAGQLPFVLVYSKVDSTLAARWNWCKTTIDCTFLANVVIFMNTAAFSTRSQLVTSRRAIWHLYWRQNLAHDLLAAVPLEIILIETTPWHLGLLVPQLIVRIYVVQRHFHRFEYLWASLVAQVDHSWLDWLFYSRFGHLARIGRLIALVVLFAHFMACLWSYLNLHVTSQPFSNRDHSVYQFHLHSIYEVLQLLQGQGVDTTTIAQDVFCSFSVLVGSITLALVFGHVAVLVGNFRANQTAYQRKMESVFAIMDKLQLPKPIRERIHQYYEYLHAEYESLDGEVVKFAKELSHTLELEVVLFKCMDVVMHVPHWQECSPDFQMQLLIALHFRIRVYLPDDYVIRRGEVGTECYIVNRGVCKLVSAGCHESPTLPLLEERLQRRNSFIGRSARLPDRRYVVRDSIRVDESVGSAEDCTRGLQSLTRGQCFGEKALIANYQRTSDVRAFTYVEMCVLEREPFQTLLARYPLDRKLVLTNIVLHSQRTTATGECKLLAAAYEVVPNATPEKAVELVVDALSPPVPDPSIVFGATDHLQQVVRSIVRNGTRFESPSTGIAELAAKMEIQQQQLDRIERTLSAMQSPLSLQETPPSNAHPSDQTKLPTSENQPHLPNSKVLPIELASLTRMKLPPRRSSERTLQLPTIHSYADILLQSRNTRQYGSSLRNLPT